jgi:hypothetical protein
MQDVNEDIEYRTLKERIKNKELSAIVWGVVGSAAAIGALALFMFPPVSTAVAALGYGTAAVVGAVAMFKEFRNFQDVRFDTQELQARREAINLSRAMGHIRGAEKEVIAAHMVGRSDGKSWADASQEATAAQVVQRG